MTPVWIHIGLRKIGRNLRPSDAFMPQWRAPSLVQKMPCRLFGDNPLSEPMMVYWQLDPRNISQRNFIWNLKLFNQENAYEGVVCIGVWSEFHRNQFSSQVQWNERGNQNIMINLISQFMLTETVYGIPNAQKIWYIHRYSMARTLVKKYVPICSL